MEKKSFFVFSKEKMPPSSAKYGKLNYTRIFKNPWSKYLLNLGDTISKFKVFYHSNILLKNLNRSNSGSFHVQNNRETENDVLNVLHKSSHW